MKPLFLIHILLLFGEVKGANYYFSSSTGDDSRTAVQAQNPASPWKTLNKLNTFFTYLRPGDSILFKRDDVFSGSITIGKSGTANLPIVLSAYGTGAKPVISGFTTLTSWTSLGGGIYQSPCSSCMANENLMVMNGTQQTMGRYPNSGYLTYQSYSGNNAISDNSSTKTQNWTGAEIVIRKNRWVIDRNKIDRYSSYTFNYTTGSIDEPTSGYGYFIQNDPKTLDQPGEWYFDDKSKNMLVFFGSNPPTRYTVKTSIVDNLVSIKGYSHIAFENLSFQGANETALRVSNSQNIHMTNCDIDLSGADAIVAENSQYINIENSIINHCLNNAIFLDKGCTNALIKNNTIKNTGLMPGMGKSGTGTYEAITSFGEKSRIEFNVIDSTGYDGIYFAGSETEVKNNFINFFCLTKDDGAGIYVGDPAITYGKKVIGNIVLNGKGAGEGTDNPKSLQAEGIYIDDNTANVEVHANTVAHCANNGIKIHNAHEVVVTDNTIFNNGGQLMMSRDYIAPNSPIRNVVVKNNTFFSKYASQPSIYYYTISNDISDFGISDSNYIAQPLDEKNMFTTLHSKEGKNFWNSYNLEEWKSAYNIDKHSKKSPITIQEYTLNKTIGPNKFSNGYFNTNINGSYCWNASQSCVASWDNSGQINGGSLKIAYTKNTDENTIIVIAIGGVSKNKNYMLKYSVKGTNANSKLGVYLRQSNSPYNNLSLTKYAPLTNTIGDQKVLLPVSETETNASIVFEANSSDGPFWLDNIELYEADVTMTNPDDYIRFEYNASTVNKVVSLDGIYMGVDSTIYSNTVTLAPYSSIVLLKAPGYQTLPLQFTDFEGHRAAKAIEVQWQTANETHTDFFEVLHSSDGQHFDAIGRKVATNKSSLSTYSFTDNKPFAGKNYYQLKQVDKDGRYTFSKIIVVAYSDAVSMQLSPNPATNQLTVSLSTAQHAPNATLQIRSVAGSLIKQMPVSFFTESIPLDISTLSKGTYIVSLLYNGTTLNQKFIKH